MRYRIGEFAEFFGMTKEGVRYLERKGIIRSERDNHNSYRYFPRTEISRFKQIRRYQGLGFSLEEAQHLIGDTQRADIVNKLMQKQRELSVKAQQLEQMQQFLALQQQTASRLLDSEASIYLGERPELIFFPRVPDESSGSTPEERREITQARAQEKEWILASPPCTLGGMHHAADGSGRVILGSIVRAELAQAFGIRETERTLHLMPCPCVCAIVESPTGQPPVLDPLFAYMEENGLTLAGDIFGICELNYLTKAGERYMVREIFAPYR